VKKNDVEYINALTPFDHGVWEGKNVDGEMVTVGDKALFQSRSLWLVDKIVSYLKDTFSQQDLLNMSVLEIGSYDGWVLTQMCSRIKFAEAVGVEPRIKNIKKGQMGRKLAGIKTQAHFLQGRSDEVDEIFPGRDFDIVICLGMLHHVSSTYDTIMSISSKSSNVCIIDSMIIPDLKDDIDSIEPFVNTRDIIYSGEENLWTVAAYKFESPYGDGNRPNYGIVNIPTAALIEMSLRSSGFGQSIALGSELDFYDDSGQKLRGVKELLCVSTREISVGDLDRKWKQKVEMSENIFCHLVLPREIILSLTKLLPEFEGLDIYSDVVSAAKTNYNDKIEDAALETLSSGLSDEFKTVFSDNVQGCNQDHFQIMSVIFRSPYEKVVLEASKFFLAEELPELAIKYLQLMIRKPGCDWWSFYRSCYLLRQSFEKKYDDARKEHYNELLLLSNEYFPF
jgi:hypothetical protein